MFDVSFSTTPSTSSMFIHLVYNEDKKISFLYIFILILTHTLSKLRIDINVIHANYSAKGNMKNYFVIYMTSLTYVNIKYNVFASTGEYRALILFFTKMIEKKLENILIFLSFL